MEIHLVSLNGMPGHGRYLLRNTALSRGRFCEDLVAKITFLGERFGVRGGGSRKASAQGEPRLSKGRFSERGGRFDDFFVNLSSSDERSSGGSESEHMPLEAASLTKKLLKPRKKKGLRKDKEAQLWQEVGKPEDSPVEAEMTVLKLEEAEGELLDMKVDSRSWINDDSHSLASVLDKLEALRLHALALEQWHASSLLHVQRKYQKSAQNLIHYVALKSVDLEELQSCLPTFGLASIEGMEGHVLASLACVTDAARALSMVLASPTQVRREDHAKSEVYRKQLDNSFIVRCDTHTKISSIDQLSTISTQRSRIELNDNTVALLGPRSSGRKTYIMVTLSEEMAENESGVLDLMTAGMDIARINCSHGSPEVWGRMIKTVKHCSQMLEKPCRVLMDLAGPKLRTSAFPPGPCVQKLKPHRDGLGNVIRPARIWIAQSNTPVPEGRSADIIVPIEGDVWLGSIQIGDDLKLRDARGRPRQLTITDKIMGSSGIGCWAECFHTTYLESGTELKFSRKKGRQCIGYVADLSPSEQFIRLKKGNLLALTRESSVLEANDSGANDSWVFRVQVSHTFGQLFESVKLGERIRFDDGKIEGVVRGVTSSEICVEVTFANDKGTKLGGEKSINLPDSNLFQKGLTTKDMVDLDFAVGHADMVGLSFVNNSEDLRILQQALEEKGATNIGVVLKIETKSGVANLSEIILQGMRKMNPLGVMIARGDLAVECGWESVAAVQDEVLRLCKAAHIPTIWATQVLEGLTKQGLPTRPEITDAALGGRAACVMLNKGLHIQKAVLLLDKILNPSVRPRWEEHRSDQPLGIPSLAD